MKIQFENTANKHHCQSRRKGDWLIFTCPKCPDYERHFNWKTGEMKSFVADENKIPHTGTFLPIGLENDYSTCN